MLHPLHALLSAKNTWEWSQKYQAAFDKAKKLLTEAPVFTHYDPSLQNMLEGDVRNYGLGVQNMLKGDVQNYGLGVVVSHIMPDGKKSPITFASWILTARQKRSPSP